MSDAAATGAHTNESIPFDTTVALDAPEAPSGMKSTWWAVAVRCCGCGCGCGWMWLAQGRSEMVASVT